MDHEVTEVADIQPLEVFRRLRFVGVVFDNRSILGAKFVECEFEDCEFTDTFMEAAGEDEAVKSDMDRSEWVERAASHMLGELDDNDPSPELWTWFANCEMVNCRFRRSSLSNVFFDHGFIKDSFFVETELDVVRFEFFGFENVLIEQASVNFVEFLSSDLDNCRFLGSTLLGCSFEGEMFIDSAFVATDLERCAFIDIQMVNTAFEKCSTRKIMAKNVVAIESMQISEDEFIDDEIDLPDFIVAALEGDS